MRNPSSQGLRRRSLIWYSWISGLWNQLIDEKDCWTETSGSAMFTYAMILGVKNGWLEDFILEKVYMIMDMACFCLCWVSVLTTPAVLLSLSDRN